MIGCGFYMPHLLGGGIVINCKSIGYGCCCNINVLVGNKGDNDHVPTIGNNVSLSPGCKIIGDIHIGDNVIIAPNSVVISDVPNDCAVAGIPAKIIKMYKHPEYN